MIVQQCKQLLQQLIDVTAKLSNEAYAQKIPLLGGASVGSHTRHIIEFVQEMLKGYRLECINYDVRKEYALIYHLQILIKSMPPKKEP